MGRSKDGWERVSGPRFTAAGHGIASNTNVSWGRQRRLTDVLADGVFGSRFSDVMRESGVE